MRPRHAPMRMASDSAGARVAADWGSPLAPGNLAGDIQPLASWIAGAFTAIAPVDHGSERSGTPMRPDGSTPYAGLADLVRIVCSTFGRNSTCFSP